MDGHRFRIRRAMSADVALLADLGARTFYDTYAADNTPENMAAYLSAHFTPENLGVELAEAGKRFLIVEQNDVAVAYACLNFGRAPRPLPARFRWSSPASTWRGPGPDQGSGLL